MAAPHSNGDRPVTFEFLDQLYGTFDDGWLTLFTIDRGTAERSTTWAPVDDTRNLAATAAALAGRCVWFGVATRHHRLGDGRRGGADDCRALPGLWVDIDVAGPNHATADLPTTLDAALDLVAAYPLPPTAIVGTGGGLQAWWLFAEPAPVDDTSSTLLARWGATWAGIAQHAGVHIDNVFDVPRIMRLPGTWNHKTDPAAPVELLAADWKLRYGLDDLDQYLEDPPPAPAVRTADRVPYIGPERPGDAYNARHSGEEVLAELGFKPHARRHSDGSLHFDWPAAAGDVGATAYADGHVTIWSETFASTHPAVAVRRPYDPFGLIVAARHAGDWAAATAELRARGYGTSSDDAVEAWMATLPATTGPGAAPGPQEVLAEALEHGWHRRPLDDVLADGYEPPRPDVLARRDGVCLLYSGRINAFHGESGSGKSWMALTAVAEALRAGRPALFVDLEDHAASVVARLRALGVPPAAIGQLFDYIAPEGPYSVPARQAVEQLVRDRQHAVVVIDSTGEAMAIDALKQNDDDAVAQWFRRLPRSLAALGPAVVLTDHIPKSDDAPRLFAIGSQRKRAAIDGVAYRVEAGVHPAKGRTGHLRLIVAKDRNGAFQTGTKVADVTVNSNDTGTDVRIRVEPGETVLRPTVLMERISRFLEGAQAQSKASIERGVKGKTDAKRAALELLVTEGFVGVHTSSQGAFHFSERPYRAPDEDLEWLDERTPEDAS